MNLLLIDDDSIDRQNTTRVLKRSGHSMDITQATSAEEGLQLHGEKYFDIILLDYHLPTMTGLDLLKLFNKSSRNNSAVVMLSNSEDETLAIECFDEGAQDFILKSEVTVSRLIRAILHSKQRKKIEHELHESREKLRNLAEKDSLTGLANRYVFEKRLNQSLSQAKRADTGLALIMLDLDNFKNVNDTLGHAAGDQLLQDVAKRLKTPVREGDVLCRLGGDEFAILVHNVESPVSLRSLTQRILSVFSVPFDIEGVDLNMTTSIGVASFPESSSDPSQLLRCADIAMYRSKEMGKNRVHFYTKSIHEAVHRRMELEHELQGALERDEFILHYQPQMNCLSGRTVGVEALIRWQHPTKGLIGPIEFIPITEETGLINDIGLWVLETVCRHLNIWNKQCGATKEMLSVAVNLSARQLGSYDFVHKVKKLLDKYQIEAEQLEFEITESVIIKSTDLNMLILRDLSDLGIKLALDDFGTGYSSLSQLHQYPFKILKIDKSFIQSIPQNDTTFLKAINAFAKTLNILTVVEGVETPVQKGWCQELKFDRMQGFLFAKPMPADEFQTFLTMENTRLTNEAGKHKITSRIG
ncbi:MAG: EAL domain-containing protein [Sneathiella sp.]|nr:EAL domain-containing protein [Sneathiella sp.]